jgi:hypothetical protein
MQWIHVVFHGLVSSSFSLITRLTVELCLGVAALVEGLQGWGQVSHFLKSWRNSFLRIFDAQMSGCLARTNTHKCKMGDLTLDCLIACLIVDL